MLVPWITKELQTTDLKDRRLNQCLAEVAAWAARRLAGNQADNDSLCGPRPRRSARIQSDGATAVWRETYHRLGMAKGARRAGEQCGDLARRREVGPSDKMKAVLRKAWSKARDPGWREKIAASKRGKPRPRHVIEILRAANLGRKASDEARAKLRAAHLARGTKPTAAGRAWDRWEDEAIRTLSATAAAEKTGRTLTAVMMRRY